MILITGGTGFIGRRIAARLAAQGRAVRLLARHPAQVAGAEVRVGSVADRASVAAAVAGCEAVIHLVGIIRETGRQTYTAVHLRGTRNVVRACQGAGVQRLLHMSALGARPDGRSRYHRSKWAAEEVVRGSGLEATVFRPSVAFGAGSDFMRTMRRLVSSPAPVIPIIGRGTSLLQPIWVEDIAACFVRALDRPETVGQSYDLGGPATYGFGQLLEMVAQAEGVDKPALHLPVALVRAAALAFGWLSFFPLTRDQLAMLLEDNVCDIRPMLRTFGIEPARLEDHLRD